MRPHPDPEAAARKLMKYFELLEVSRELALAGLRHQHPEASETEIRALWHERLKRSRDEKWKNA